MCAWQDIINKKNLLPFQKSETHPPPIPSPIFFPCVILRALAGSYNTAATGGGAAAIEYIYLLEYTYSIVIKTARVDVYKQRERQRERQRQRASERASGSER